MSIHHLPFKGFAPGASTSAASSSRFTSARTINAALLTPSRLYAARRPYSLRSEPWIGVELAVCSKNGIPNRSTRSRWLVILNALPALALVVAEAVLVPAPLVLSWPEATTIRGTVPGSAGV